MCDYILHELESCMADHAAKAIVMYGLGSPITDDRSPTKTPGSFAEAKGSHP